MRQITLPDKTTIEVRGLTRKEVKEFRAKGINFSAMQVGDAEEILDDVFSKIFTPEQIEKVDELENKYAIGIWNACLKETFGAPDEEKNS